MAPDGPANPRAKSAYQAAMIAGEAALYSGRYDQARLRFLEAMDLKPRSVSPALGALRSMTVKGRAEERRSIAERIRSRIAQYRQREATYGAAFLLEARLALALNQHGLALDHARLAVEQMPDLGVSWRVLGEAAMGAELWGEAIESFQTAVALGLTAEAGTWERMADCFDELGELQAAEDAISQALRMTGDDPHAKRRRLNLQAAIAKHEGDLERAQRIAEAASALGEDDPAVMHNLASIAEASGRFGQALELYHAAVAESAIPTTYFRIGVVQLKLDRPNRAARAFVRAAGALDRWNWPASTRWMPAFEAGKLYARGKQYRRAIGWFEDALREARTATATREIVSWLGYARLVSVDEAAASRRP